MSDFSGRENSRRARNIFNVGIATNLLMLIIFLFSYYSGNDDWFTLALMINGIGYIGAFIGNLLRIYGMPDYYFTDGTLWGNVKKRFYWSHGPQLIGFFFPYIVFIAIVILTA